MCIFFKTIDSLPFQYFNELALNGRCFCKHLALFPVPAANPSYNIFEAVTTEAKTVLNVSLTKLINYIIVVRW